MAKGGHRVVLRSMVSSDALSGSGARVLRERGMWRRASEVLREGVSAGWECACSVETVEVDAIITATGLGCLGDTEVFLKSVVEGGGEIVSATPFMQSTFNAVGAQLALLLENTGYNMSYVGRCHAFEDALLDAQLRILGGESNAVLVGAYDEATPLAHDLRDALYAEYDRGAKRVGGGSIFCLLTAGGDEGLELVDVHFPTQRLSSDDVRALYGDLDSRVEVNTWQAKGMLYPTISARALYDVWSSWGGHPAAQGGYLLYNDYHGESGAVIHLGDL